MPRNPTRHGCIAQDRPSGPGRDIVLNRDVFLVGPMVQRNLRLTYCVHLSNRTCEVAQRRPSSVAQENVRQCLLLLWPAPFIHVEDNAPRSTRFIVAITSSQHDRKIREIDVTCVTLKDAPREGEVAGAIGRAPSSPRAMPPAGADGFAVTHFVVGPTDNPGYEQRHDRPPPSRTRHMHSIGWKNETRSQPRH